MAMFKRLERPFLTVVTGEAYQPIRLTYDIKQKEKLAEALSNIRCMEQKQPNSWTWYWQEECDNLHFESLETYKKSPDKPVRLGTLSIRDGVLYFNLPSFKRACLAVPFFHRVIAPEIAEINKADFINKVFGLSERLPHGFSELFDENELDVIVSQRVEDYIKIQERCEKAATAEEAFQILSDYTKSESEKRLPYAERYNFHHGIKDRVEPDVIFLGFYIFLRGRELVAIRRWFGESGYTLANAADETIEQVFGGVNLDIIDNDE